MAQSWDTLRKDARRLETEIETKLVTYSKLSASLSTSSSRTSAFDPSRAGEGEFICSSVDRSVPLVFCLFLQCLVCGGYARPLGVRTHGCDGYFGFALPLAAVQCERNMRSI